MLVPCYMQWNSLDQKYKVLFQSLQYYDILLRNKLITLSVYLIKQANACM